MATSCCPYISNKSHKQAQGRKWGSEARADFWLELTHLSTMCVWSSESPSMAVHSGHLNFFRGVTCQRSTKIYLVVSAKDNKIMLVTPLCTLLFCKLSCLLPPHAYMRPYMGTRMRVRARTHTHTDTHTSPFLHSILSGLANSRTHKGPIKKAWRAFAFCN